jgi:hypothetical protein
MLPNGGGNVDQSALTTLSKLKLQQLSATPTQIGPFGESTVRWVVSGPPGGFTVTLNGVPVGIAGSQLVQPLATTGYTLAARAGPYTRTLGYVTVQVDLDACQIIAQPAEDVHKMLSNFVRSAVLGSDSSLYFRQYQVTVKGVTVTETYVPVITFLPGLIQIVLNLGKRINDKPDPSIDVTIVMSLSIVDGALQAGYQNVTGTVSEPWWVYALPGAIIWLSIELSAAQDALPMEFAPLIAAIPEFLAEAVYPLGPGMKYQNILIVADPTTQPIQLMACPAPALGTVSTVQSISSIGSFQVMQRF